MSVASMKMSKLYTYACDDVRYKRKDNPTAWTTVGTAPETMFKSYPFFEFIPGSKGEQEPKRYGDYVIDIDSGPTACQDAIRIIAYVESVYGVDPDQWRVYLSGKKGTHLELPANILGTIDGHIYLTLSYKRFSKEIEGELDVKLDLSMYNSGSGKPYRQANVMREGGTCKRQIEHSDLYEIMGEDEYRLACNEPGDLWEPVNIDTNPVLAEKIRAYLQEAVDQQEGIKNAPKMSGDELDRLALCVPPCISMLANLTDNKGTSNTFNDVAIQLTAYAVTTGRTEADFLAGCGKFVNNYPSSSLDNTGKRYDNCRARYRTMAANGNQHSCGGVLALGFPGFDCKTCTVAPDRPQIVANVMSVDDLVQMSTTLHIPESVLNPGGLISLGMSALSQPGMPDIPQYNLPVVLTTIANAIAGKIIYAGTWPNVYNIKVGPTSTGKTTSDVAVVEAITEAGGEDFYGPTDFASGPALMRGLMVNPKCLVVIDEATSIFRRYERADPVSDGKRDALLEIYSKSGQKINKAYADNRQTIKIEYPCVSLTGNATPVVFDAIQQEDFDTGTMQRFDFWGYDGPTPERGLCMDSNPLLSSFAGGVLALCGAKSADAGNLQGPLRVPVRIGATQKALDALADWSTTVVSRCNQASSEGEKGIVSRQYTLAIKYSLIHLAATRPIQSIFEPVEERDIEYGIEVAKMLAGWKLSVAYNRVSMGEFHKRCEVFKQAIAAMMRTGQRPTFKSMANRRAELKNWKLRDSEEVISVLLKRGEIVLDESKRNTSYLLVKNKNTTI